MDYFDYGLQDFIPSEISGKRAVDIHHIDARGMGGSDKDDITNLMALTREEHILLGDRKDWIGWLRTVHIHFIETKTPWLIAFPDEVVYQSFIKK